MSIGSEDEGWTEDLVGLDDAGTSDGEEWAEDEEWFDDDESEVVDGSGSSVTVELSASLGPTDPHAEPLLRTGEIEVLGRMPWSSNGTFLATVTDGEHHTNAIYKPERLERPLWDYPPGLWRREIATFELARSLGWPIIPPTVQRDDAPLGAGSIQFFVPADFAQHYFTLRDEPRFATALRQMCVLDLVANNCDRKGGHVLLGADDRIWGIDHGLSFHREFKLRTVIWDFAGERIGIELANDVRALIDAGLSDELVALLDPFERAATLDRAAAVVASATFPSDPTGRRVPWPMV